MRYPLPEVLTADALDRLRNAREQWDPAVRAIARDHGLSVEHIECLEGSNLVAGVGPDHVIKLIPSIYRREYEGELGGVDASHQKFSGSDAAKSVRAERWAHGRTS